METREVNVQLKRVKRICSAGMLVLCMGITMSPLHANQGIQAGQNGHAVSIANQKGPMKLTAGGNPRSARPITISASKVAAVSRSATINVQPTTVVASVSRAGPLSLNRHQLDLV